MEPDADACRCHLSSERECKLSKVLTKDLFTKMIDFRFDGQSNKKLSFLLWDKRKRKIVFHFVEIFGEVFCFRRFSGVLLNIGSFRFPLAVLNSAIMLLEKFHLSVCPPSTI